MKWTELSEDNLSPYLISHLAIPLGMKPGD